jgi:hypothetical protein
VHSYPYFDVYHWLLSFTEQIKLHWIEPIAIDCQMGSTACLPCYWVLHSPLFARWVVIDDLLEQHVACFKNVVELLLARTDTFQRTFVVMGDANVIDKPVKRILYAVKFAEWGALYSIYTFVGKRLWLRSILTSTLDKRLSGRTNKKNARKMSSSTDEILKYVFF